ncbi:MAG: endonuclease domain-containing protein [Anaerolineae bacterium]|nr:endonuclease domain-containing protein [Anaerolineae bacterium]
MKDTPKPERDLPFHATGAQWATHKPLARQMRHEPTAAEDALWQRLRNRQVGGAKFRRQYAIEYFIVDFVCMEQRLIVEVDGSVHDLQAEYDADRQAVLESKGFRVLRFTNDDVFRAMPATLATIAEALR